MEDKRSFYMIQSVPENSWVRSPRQQRTLLSSPFTQILCQLSGLALVLPNNVDSQLDMSYLATLRQRRGTSSPVPHIKIVLHERLNLIENEGVKYDLVEVALPTLDYVQSAFFLARVPRCPTLKC